MSPGRPGSTSDDSPARDPALAAQRPHLSMVRTYTLADLFTLANACCGTLTIFLCLTYIANDRRTDLWAAFALPAAALVFDLLDGYVARRHRRRQSILGADLDSLADIISFGVAPAVLGFTLGLRGFWDILCLTYFVCCGISRLARFNVTSTTLADTATGKVKYFEGTPIPSSIIIVIILALLFATGATGPDFWLGQFTLLNRIFHPFSLIFVLSGSAMISATLRIPKP